MARLKVWNNTTGAWEYVGVQAANVTNANIITNEVPGGTINGSNQAFTTVGNFATGSLKVFKNGIRLKGGGADYTEGTSAFTMVTAPATGTVLLVDYMVSVGVNSIGTNSNTSDETPTGLVNSSNTVYTCSKPYNGGTLEVFINGVKQVRTTHFTETTPSTGIFTMGDAPLTGDVISVNYQYSLGNSANADTVDGRHANSVPTANQLLALDASAKIPTSVVTNLITPDLAWIEVGSGGSAPAFQNSWANYDAATFNSCAYRKDAMGYVHLRGLVKTGASATTIFTLPVGYRPARQQLVSTVAYTTGMILGRIDIFPNGNVGGAGSVTGNTYTTLDNITFLAEQ